MFHRIPSAATAPSSSVGARACSNPRVRVAPATTERSLNLTLLNCGVQNFFTTVKALVSQAEAEGPKLDGKNRFQQAERELTDR